MHLSFNLRIGFPSGLFPSDLPINIQYAFLISPIDIPFTAHFILPHFITLIIFNEG
jgi:hypothetical protein